MSTQGRIVAAVVAAGMAVLAAVSVTGSDQEITAGFWFEGISVRSSDELAGRLGGRLTPDELAAIESVARAELRRAFVDTRLVLSDSRAAMYRIRVLERLRGPRMILPVAGLARPLPGRRGDGAVSFSVIAGGAIAYAPPSASRETFIEAIGRGIGRTAAHEFAHQLLRSFPLHNTTDRLSYEYPHLRPEHYYNVLHWGVAWPRLQAGIGRAQLTGE